MKTKLLPIFRQIIDGLSMYCFNRNYLSRGIFALALLMITINSNSIAQCNNANAFGTYDAPTNNVVKPMTTCLFGGEYQTINNAVAGQTYQFSATGGLGNYITVRQGTPGGTILAFGFSPVNATVTVSGPVYMHVNVDAACATEAICRSTFIQCTSCPPDPIPSNDLCVDAININCGETINSTTTGAGIDAAPTCNTTFGTAGGVWYKFTGTGENTTLSLCGSAYDTKLGVFTGSCGALSCVVGNDDFCGLQSQLSFTTTFGTDYFVLVTGFSNNTSNFTLTRTCIYDPCANIVPLTCGTNVSVPLTGFGAWNPGTCGFNTPGQERVFSFTPTVSGSHTLEVTTLSGGSRDYYFKDASGGCNSSGWTCIGDANGPETNTFGPLTAGTTYYILVDAEVTASLSQSFQINCPPSCVITCPPDIIVDNDPGICGAVVTFSPTVTGNCPATTANPASGSTFPIGTTTVTVTETTGSTTVCSFTVTVNQTTPSQPGTISGPIGACKGQNGITYCITPQADATSYIWTLPTGVTGSSTGPCITVNFKSNFNGGPICVKAMGPCGNVGPNRCLNIIKFSSAPSTPVSISGPALLCPAVCGTFSVSPISTATSYQWSVANGLIVTNGQGTTTATICATSAFRGGDVKVYAKNCKGKSGTKTLRVLGQSGTPGPISGKSSVCSNATKCYSISAVAGASSYTWVATNNAIIVSGQGSRNVCVQFNSSGQVTLTVNANGLCGASPTSSKTISVSYNPCRNEADGSLVEEQEIEDIATSFEAYPNPTAGKLTIAFNSDRAANYSLKVLDLTGRILITENISSIVGYNSSDINLEGLAEGMYVISLQTEGVEIRKTRVILE